ncbi:HAD-IIIC family phosphatase [Gluconobacter oxydans]|uniref:Uncharacterized protein n=1 Tax=Gluconobacter oxydans TaxID=442 RepID=A0A149S8N1_GLUOY|nr:HAD-IIIC family phosphatase [Gluconobacter oxydans]KXV23055.1 hypothetical protein AD934_00655 [Gluconobacter oxydans]
MNEAIRLVIWDLDDTFWTGTLSEGGISYIDSHHDIIIELAKRGIMSSICSKNDFQKVDAVLTEKGIRNYFVFPSINWDTKSHRIARTIKDMQLRPVNVMFIDDNIMNLNEVKHYIPDIQIAGPEIIGTILQDSRFQGKPDPEMTRLDRYRILERKYEDSCQSGGDNLDFLRSSNIRISFHHDVEHEMFRIHELINRTNQLNFTKNRVPENLDAFREIMIKKMENFNSNISYVKVSDKYGNYGICGFFSIEDGKVEHFLFSCRSMNMGIEQFVWQKLGRPQINIAGDVSSILDDNTDIDWITVVDDADNDRDDITTHAMTICIRGACDLAVSSFYLRKYTLFEEFAYPYRNWGIQPVVRALEIGSCISREERKAISENMPGMPVERFSSHIITQDVDVFILSFSGETFCDNFYSKSFGLVFPLSGACVPYLKNRDRDYERIKQEIGMELSEAEWNFMLDDLDFYQESVSTLFERDIRSLFNRLRGKRVILCTLNEEFGSQKWVLDKFSRINSITIPLAMEHNFRIVDVRSYVRGTDDLITPNDAGGHFKRNVYMKISSDIEEHMRAWAQDPLI